MPIKLEIVTPEARVFADEVDTVVLPGYGGEMGVLPAHAPTVTTLLAGELRYIKAGQTHELAVGEGIVEITGQSAKVLVDSALRDSQIDETAVQAALERAQARLADKASLSAEEVAAVEASISRSLVQLRVKRRRTSV
jgi:F-type H+-transporting ATPase subunit epsilon